MSGTALLQELTGRGIELWVEGEQLRYRGSKSVLTPAVLAQLKEAKPMVMETLCREGNVVESTAEVFDLARRHFPDRDSLPVPPPPPGGDPLVQRGTDKVRFFRGDWRRAYPQDFEVHKGGATA